VFVAALVPLLFALNPLGINGIALAQLGATAAAVTGSLFFMQHYLHVSPFALLSTTVRPLVASVLMGAAVYTLESMHFGLPPDTVAPVLLLLGVLAGIAVYVPLLALLWLLAGRPDGAERIVAQRVLGMFAQLRGASAGRR
jgi:lipopolysaccharide exporter